MVSERKPHIRVICTGVLRQCKSLTAMIYFRCNSIDISFFHEKFTLFFNETFNILSKLNWNPFFSIHEIYFWSLKINYCIICLEKINSSNILKVLYKRRIRGHNTFLKREKENKKISSTKLWNVKSRTLQKAAPYLLIWLTMSINQLFEI